MLLFIHQFELIILVELSITVDVEVFIILPSVHVALHSSTTRTTLIQSIPNKGKA